MKEFKANENLERGDMVVQKNGGVSKLKIEPSDYELELIDDEKKITCIICGKNWLFLEERGFMKIKSAYTAEKNESYTS